MAVKSIANLPHKAYIKHEIIPDLVKGKRVVHYGCVDDDEALIKHKFEEGYYLHKLVTDSSKSTIGIDLNKKAFKFLERELGINNIVYGNVEDPKTFDVKIEQLKNIDIVLVPDLIEHLYNPGNMLLGIRKFFSDKIKLIIVTPNPSAWYNFAATLLNREIYSPYHTAYFTTESMNVLLSNHGFKVKRILPVTSPKRRGLFLRIADKVFSRASVFISPGFADLYLYECVVDKRFKLKS